MWKILNILNKIALLVLIVGGLIWGYVAYKNFRGTGYCQFWSNLSEDMRKVYNYVYTFIAIVAVCASFSLIVNAWIGSTEKDVVVVLYEK